MPVPKSKMISSSWEIHTGKCLKLSPLNSSVLNHMIFKCKFVLRLSVCQGSAAPKHPAVPGTVC